MKYLTSKALIVFSLMLYSSVVFSQKNVSNEQIQTTLKKHITFLADDKLEGRLVGSAGEKTAYEYIIKNLQQSKVESVNGNSFLQEFK